MARASRRQRPEGTHRICRRPGAAPAAGAAAYDAGVVAAAVPRLDRLLLPRAARPDVLAQFCGERLRVARLCGAVHLAALRQGHADDAQSGEPRHRAGVAPRLSGGLRPDHEQRAPPRADPGLRVHSVLGRHHRTQLFLADHAGRPRADQQSADQSRHRGRPAGTSLQHVQRAGRHGANRAAAHHPAPVLRPAAPPPHPVAAAKIHGASPWQAFRTVFFPLSLPGVYGAGLLVFVLSLGFYVTPALLGSPRQTMIAQTIMVEASDLLDWGQASAAGFVLLVITTTIAAIYNRYFALARLWGGSEP